MRETTLTSLMIGLIAVGAVFAVVRMSHSSTTAVHQAVPQADVTQNQSAKPPPLTNLTATTASLPLVIDDFAKKWEQARQSLQIQNMAVPAKPHVQTGADVDQLQLQLTPDLYLHGNIDKSSGHLQNLNLFNEKAQATQNVRDEEHALEILTRMLLPTFDDQDVNAFVEGLYQTENKEEEAQGVRFVLKRSEQIEEITIQGFADPTRPQDHYQKTTSS